MLENNNSVTESFIYSYKKEFFFFHELAKKTSDLIEKKLYESGIKAIVSFRAKGINNLYDKLKKRDSDSKRTKYESIEEIYNDIVDLAGVRVALYFPSEILQVSNIIEREFEVQDSKNFPENKKNKNDNIYKKRFDGYHAKHYRVKLKSEGDFSNHLVEIQIASVLMHAWSEVEHDLDYKPSSGSLSVEELMILDEINGMVISGNIALERLQAAMLKRVSDSNYIFKDHYDLAAYISSRIPDGEIVNTREFYNLLNKLNCLSKERVASILNDVEKRIETTELRTKGLGDRKHEDYSTVYANRLIELIFIRMICKECSEQIINLMADGYEPFNDTYLHKKIVWDCFEYGSDKKLAYALKVVSKLHTKDSTAFEEFDFMKFSNFLEPKSTDYTAEDILKIVDNFAIKLRVCLLRRFDTDDLNSVYKAAAIVHEKVAIKKRNL